jgi:RNA polymerase sigma factor (sigma-70 family)
MRREDIAAIRWIEVTLRRAGHRTVERYLRYAQHEQPTDPIDVSAVGTPLDEFPDLDGILDLQRAFAELPEDERKVLWLSIVEDIPQVRIAARLHLSQPRVSQLRRQALHRIQDLVGEKKGSR